MAPKISQYRAHQIRCVFGSHVTDDQLPELDRALQSDQQKLVAMAPASVHAQDERCVKRVPCSCDEPGAERRHEDIDWGEVKHSEEPLEELERQRQPKKATSASPRRVSVVAQASFRFDPKLIAELRALEARSRAGVQ